MKEKRSRRDFLKISVAGAVGAVVLSKSSFGSSPSLNPSESGFSGVADPKRLGVGIQLYSIREEMAKDVPGTLKKVSEIGYKYLELADYSAGKFYGYEPSEFKKITDGFGLVILSSHTQVEGAGITLENARKMAADHAIIGAKYCIQPWVVEEMRKPIATWERMADNWNQIGKIMKESGLQFGYHNHNFEFATIEGKVPYYDILMKNLEKDLVTMELDLFWATKAGQDPIKMIKKYPGRFQLFHLKDMYTKQEPFYDVIKDDIAPVGAGIINFKKILKYKDLAGMKYRIVEQDQGKGGIPTSFGDITTSMHNLTTKILKK